MTQGKHRIGCKSMQDAVVVGSIFMTAGVIMLAVGRSLVPSIAFLDYIVQALGGILLLFVPFILIATFLRTLDERDDDRAKGNAD